MIAFISLFINYHSIKAYAGTEKVYLGGFALGFDLSSEGALVVGLSEVICDNGICLPAREAGIKSGDCILSLNGIKINCANDIDAVLGNCDGNFIVVEVLSNGEKCIKNVFPQKDIFKFTKPDYNTYKKIMSSIANDTQEAFTDKINEALKAFEI